jgi:hypothetical protein
VNVLADHVAAYNMSARHISELRRDFVPDPDIALLAQLSTAAGITLRCAVCAGVSGFACLYIALLAQLSTAAGITLRCAVCAGVSGFACLYIALLAQLSTAAGITLRCAVCDGVSGFACLYIALLAQLSTAAGITLRCAVCDGVLSSVFLFQTSCDQCGPSGCLVWEKCRLPLGRGEVRTHDTTVEKQAPFFQPNPHARHRVTVAFPGRVLVLHTPLYCPQMCACVFRRVCMPACAGAAQGECAPVGGGPAAAACRGAQESWWARAAVRDGGRAFESRQQQEAQRHQTQQEFGGEAHWQGSRHALTAAAQDCSK